MDAPLPLSRANVYDIITCAKLDVISWQTAGRERRPALGWPAEGTHTEGRDMDLGEMIRAELAKALAGMNAGTTAVAEAPTKAKAKGKAKASKAESDLSSLASLVQAGGHFGSPIWLDAQKPGELVIRCATTASKARAGTNKRGDAWTEDIVAWTGGNPSNPFAKSAKVKGADGQVYSVQVKVSKVL